MKSRKGESSNVKFFKYYSPTYCLENISENNDIDDVTTNLKEKLVNSVEKRLMSDVPYAVLLSGGLDSSHFSITYRIRTQRVKNFTHFLD